METEVKGIINADRKSVWNTITDIENAPQTISGIEKVEILEKPASGMVGFKWRETRTMFGQTGATKKALAKDLQDIKAAVERKPAV